MPEPAEPIVVVNVVAASYSGATWLNLMFGAHPLAFSIGEMDHIRDTGKPICRLDGEACPIWSRFDPASAENPYLQLARITGKRFLVVNNTKEFLAAQRDSRIAPRYIWLIRDGRAVVASFLRKYPQRSVIGASRWFNKAIRKKRQLIDAQDPAHAVRLRYEELVADTPGHVRRLCEFVGLPFDEKMLDYTGVEQHFLGGSRATLQSLAEVQDKKLHNARLEEKRADLDFYRQSDLKHLVDDRWKRELSDWQLRLFALVAGRTNRKLGYPRALDRG
jgi:hypothetical protein